MSNHKNILVVGGTSGIGKEILSKLSREDVSLWSASRTSIDEFSDWHVNHIEVDVTADDLSTLEGNLPDTLHGLVYCPGTINLKPFQSLKLEDFRDDLELNLLGAVKVLQACQKKLKNPDGASVVLFSTVAARTGMSFHTSIAAAKAAIVGMAISLASEWAKQKIRVNVVAPSLTDTPLAERLLSNEQRRESSAERHPLKRVGTPSDIAAAVCYLLDDSSSWVTGQIFSVDGGLSTLQQM